MRFNRDLPKYQHEPPTQEEMDYVRALLAPFEQTLPIHERTRKVYPPRPITFMTPEQLLAEYRKTGASDIRVRMLADAYAASTVSTRTTQ